MTMIQDNNNPGSTSMKQTMFRAELAQRLLKNALPALKDWLPDGEIHGHEYKALNPRRNDQHIGSFSINLSTGLWSDFATSDKGADLVSLYSYIHQIDEVRSYAQLNQYCNESGFTSNPTYSLSIANARVKAPCEMIPAHEMTRLPPDSDLDGNTVTASWEYRTAENEILFYVLRTEPAPGKKETKPCRLAGGRWTWNYPDGKFPLYNVHRLSKGNPVYFGEGEKNSRCLRYPWNRYWYVLGWRLQSLVCF